MRIYIDALNRRLLATLPTPPIRIAHEKQLLVAEMVQAGEVEVLRVAGGGGGRGLRWLARLPCCEGCADAPCVGDVFAERELAVDVQGFLARSFDCEIRVLVDKTFCAGLEGRDGGVRPPVGIIAVLIVMAACRIKSMRQFVPGHGPECPVAQVLRYVYIENGKLHDAGWEDDFVSRRVVIRVHSWNGHAPFVAVDGFAKRGPFVGDFEAAHGERVRKKCGGGDVYGEIVVLEN